MTPIAVPLFIKPGLNIEDSIEEIEDAFDPPLSSNPYPLSPVPSGMIELRCDTATPRLMLEAVEFAHLPTIVTVRPTFEGGHCEKDDEYRIGLWEQAIDAGVEFIDIELVTWERNKNVRDRISEAAEKSGTRIILSTHSFDGMPKDLEARVTRMRRIKQADVLKIAFKADTILDAIEAIKLQARLQKEDRRPSLVLAMGEEGMISRLLAAKCGAAFTFAAIENGAESAPGQPTVHELIHKYRWSRQNPNSPVYGVAGWPIGHSKSPDIHNAGFDAVNAEGIYVPLAIRPGAFPGVLNALKSVPDLNLRGMSVTIPHKEAAFKYVVDHNGKIDDLSWRVGVLNTLVWEPDGTFRGFNSDLDGALDALATALDNKRENLAGKRIAVIGAGGAARAIVAGLAAAGSIVIIYNRTRARADALADDLGQGTDGRVIAGDWSRLNAAEADIYINCTPLGMHPNVATSPLESAPTSWNNNTIVFDTVYNPPITKLLRLAQEKGAQTVQGGEMFLRQAASQFKAFTGKDAPLETFRKALQ